MKFLHTADLHLGRSFPGLSPERAKERREDLKQVLRNLVVQCNDHAVDLLIIAGNLFDSPEPPAIWPRERLRAPPSKTFRGKSKPEGRW